MIKINKKIINILQKLTKESPNFIAKGGSSLLIRNYDNNLNDYRSSIDIDLTILGLSKGKGPSSQFEPNKLRLNTFLDELNIKYTFENINPRRAIYKCILDDQQIVLESSVPHNNEYEEYDIVSDIRLAKLEKVIADKIMILIEYHSKQIDLTGEYIRHIIDILMIEKQYGFSIKENYKLIKNEIIKRIELNSKNQPIYNNLKFNFNSLMDNFLLKDGNAKYIKNIIFNSDKLYIDIKDISIELIINDIAFIISEVCNEI